MACAIEGDDNGETDGDFGGCDGDNKEDEDLRVVIGQPISADMESREGHQREIGGIQHQFEAHEDDDDVAPQKDSGEAKCEEESADEEVMVQGERIHGRRTVGRLLEFAA